MRNLKSALPLALRLLSTSCLCLATIVHAHGQDTSVALRQTAAARAYARYDIGPLAQDVQLRRMRLVLSQSLAKKNALERLLTAQRDKGSALYHAWVSAEEYGRKFGADTRDIDRATVWLKANGFTDIEVPNGANFISFSGPAQRAATAFQITFHAYSLHGETHYANHTPPHLPWQMARFVSSIQGLDDFSPHARHQQPLVGPAYVAADGTQSLGPADLAKIYDIGPLYSAGMKGSGSTIGVIGAGSPSVADFRAYKQLFGLPQNDFQLVNVPESSASTNGGDTGIEAALDLEVAGGIAPEAKLLYVQDPDVIGAVAYAIDKQLADVLSMSYTMCELPGPEDYAYEALALQAEAEGITWVNASGDSGAAGCEQAGTPAATSGLAVNLPASLPEVTGVGGSEFIGGSAGSGWTDEAAAGSASALSYLPEQGWNGSADGQPVTASGGGISQDFFKPGYQSSIEDGELSREVPDIAFDSAEASPPYLIIAGGQVMYVGGTSAATPLFAGITAVVGEYLSAHGQMESHRLGNINPELYRLQQTAPRVFHDITTGNNIVSCISGSVDCVDGSLGYQAGPGYDRVTGLGSVDAFNLAANWSSATFGTSSISISAGDAQTASGATIAVHVEGTTNPASGAVIVRWTNPAYSLAPVEAARVLLDSGGNASTVLTGLPQGTNRITASFEGNTDLLGSVSNVVAVSIGSTSQPIASVALLNVQSEIASGKYLPMAASVAGNLGMPTGTVQFFLGSTLMGSSPVVAGVAAALSTQLPSAGSNVLTARYGGDATYPASSSPGISVLIDAPSTITAPANPQPAQDFTLDLPTSITVSAGSSASFPMTITPVGGFASNILFSCSGEVSGYQCSIPASLTPSGATTMSVDLVAQAASSCLPWLPGFLLWARSRRRRKFLGVLVVGCGLLSAVGCGLTTNKTANPASLPVQGGTYRLTVSATSSTVVHHAVVNVIVQ